MTSLPYGIRDDRHADAGSSQLGQSRRREQLADVVLGEAGFVERAAHAVLARRLAAGAVVAAIVGVVAVDDRRRSRARAPARPASVELVLAVVAAVGGVGAVLGPLELGGVDRPRAGAPKSRAIAARAGDGVSG